MLEKQTIKIKDFEIVLVQFMTAKGFVWKKFTPMQWFIVEARIAIATGNMNEFWN